MHHKKRITFVFNRTGILVIVKLEIFFFFLYRINSYTVNINSTCHVIEIFRSISI